MANAKIHCPKCGRPLLTQVALAEGSTFVVKCPNPVCFSFVRVIVDFNSIHKKLLLDVNERSIITEEGKQ